MTRAWRWYLLSAVVIVFDHATKALATAKLAYGVPHTVLPVFDLTLMHNRGAAFSMLSNAGGWQRWFFSAIAIAVGAWIALWLYRLPPGKGWLATSLALILGGALGNLIDRLVHGYVVDFIHVHWGPHYFPAFNIADSAISVGAAMMVIDALILDRKGRDHAHPAG
jgi:signal peptidase II